MSEANTNQDPSEDDSDTTHVCSAEVVARDGETGIGAALRTLSESVASISRNNPDRDQVSAVAFVVPKKPDGTYLGVICQMVSGIQYTMASPEDCAKLDAQIHAAHIDQQATAPTSGSVN